MADCSEATDRTLVAAEEALEGLKDPEDRGASGALFVLCICSVFLLNCLLLSRLFLFRPRRLLSPRLFPLFLAAALAASTVPAALAEADQVDQEAGRVPSNQQKKGHFLSFLGSFSLGTLPVCCETSSSRRSATSLLHAVCEDANAMKSRKSQGKVDFLPSSFAAPSCLSSLSS
jgi:hypothetical protein